ncbi:MAG: hypothetical protein ACI9WU_005511 [Myxococcota bacterium]|jgi:hypothetical protein
MKLPALLTVAVLLTGCSSDSSDPPADGAEDTFVAPADANEGTPDTSAAPDTPTPPQDSAGGEPDISEPDTSEPTEVTHRVEIGGWSMTPGEETTRCVVLAVGNETAVSINAIRTKLAPGSHHLIVYRTNDPVNNTPVKCEPFSDTLSSQPLMISEIPEETLQLPKGVALDLDANQHVRLEVHYLNYFPEDIEAHASVEFVVLPDDEVESKANMVLYGTSNFFVPPGGSQTTPWSSFDMPNGSQIYAVTGHTHQWGTNVDIEVTRAGGDPEAIYPGDTPFVWAEAPVKEFSPALTMAPGDGLRMRCSWQNDSDKGVTFGLSAKAEMCVLWAYYYPSTGYQICIDGLFPTCPSDD